MNAPDACGHRVAELRHVLDIRDAVFRDNADVGRLCFVPLLSDGETVELSVVREVSLVYF